VSGVDNEITRAYRYGRAVVMLSMYKDGGAAGGAEQEGGCGGGGGRSRRHICDCE
jgi:hypothetical protein